MPSTNPLSARMRIQSSPKPGEMPAYVSSAPLVERRPREDAHRQLAAPLELRVHRQLRRRRDVVDRRDAELGEVLLRRARFAQTLVERLGRDRARARARAPRRTRARSRAHSRTRAPRPAARTTSPARSSATPFASHALRSHRLSSTGVVAAHRVDDRPVGREARRARALPPRPCCSPASPRRRPSRRR